MNQAVIGLGFGDEGKGCTVDWLCSLNPNVTVVRYSGGHQAGHHVQIGEKSHIFSNFGSGSLRGCDTYWSERCTIDPVAIQKEYRYLRSFGVKPRLYINNRCPITTLIEKHANMRNSATLEHGSCGVGFFETLKREQSGHSILANDIEYPFVLETKYKLADNAKNVTSKCARPPGEFMYACRWMSECPDITFVDEPPTSDSYIYEGSQGLLLDKDIGFFPHVTPSNVGSKYFRDNLLSPQHYFVTRAYQTRHGNGPMTDRDPDFSVSSDYDKTNKPNQYQKSLRASVLDLELLKYGLKKNGPTSYDDVLVITCLEHLETYSFFDGTMEYFDDKEQFCLGVGAALGFERIVMCENYTFTVLSSNY